MRRLIALCLVAATAPATASAAPRDRVAAQCERILDGFWRAVQPALPWLRLAPDANLEHTYKTSIAAGRMREECRDFSDETRRCLESARDPLTAIRRCGADPFTFRPPGLTPLSPLAQPEKLAPDAQRRELARLRGRWADDRDKLILELDGDGRARASWKPGELRAAVEEAGWLSLRTEGSREELSFALEDPTTLRLCVNSLYSHGTRTGTDRAFIARAFEDLLFFDGGRCTVVTKSGEVLPASCALEDQSGRKLFRFSYARAYWPIDHAERLLLPGQLVDPACPVLRRR